MICGREPDNVARSVAAAETVHGCFCYASLLGLVGLQPQILCPTTQPLRIHSKNTDMFTSHLQVLSIDRKMFVFKFSVSPQYPCVCILRNLALSLSRSLYLCGESISILDCFHVLFPSTISNKLSLHLPQSCV